MRPCYLATGDWCGGPRWCNNRCGRWPTGGGRGTFRGRGGQGWQGHRCDWTCSGCHYPNYPYRVQCRYCGTPRGGPAQNLPQLPSGPAQNTNQLPGPAQNPPQLPSGPAQNKKKRKRGKKKRKTLTQSLWDFRDLLEETHFRGSWQCWAATHTDEQRLVQMAAWPGVSQEFFNMRAQARKKKLVGRQLREEEEKIIRLIVERQETG